MSLFKSKEERLYYEIACRADEIILESIVGEMPSRQELQEMYTFSEEFERKMRALIESIGQRSIIPMRVKRIIVIAAIIAALILGALGASAILRSVYDFYLSYHEDHSVATYNETSNTDYAEKNFIESYYEPSYIPDGYVQTYRMENGIDNCIVYQNDDKTITFTQSTSTLNMQLDTENSDIVYFSMDGFEAHYINNNGYVTLVCEKNGYVFRIDGDISSSVAIQIAQSIKIK